MSTIEAPRPMVAETAADKLKRIQALAPPDAELVVSPERDTKSVKWVQDRARELARG